MGNNASCLADSKILKNYSINTEETFKCKKINPLQYIEPLGYEKEDFNIPMGTLDFDFNTIQSMGKETLTLRDGKELEMEKENLMASDKGKHDSRRLSGKGSAIEDNDEDGEDEVHDIVKVKWNKFIKMKRRCFEEDYKILNEIGRGGFGCVYKVVMKNGGILRAAKKINKEKLKQDEHENLLAEMAIMMSLDHPNITKLFEVYDQKSYYVMVLELCDGGELFEKIVNQNIRESEAKSIIHQVLNALTYMHEKGIVHRDIKPENMLFEKRTNLVKIIDFGISIKTKPGVWLTSRVGTPYYIAPEVLLRKYNEKCDIWSLGVVLYMIIFNAPPFKGKNAVQVMENVVKDQVYFKNKTKFTFEAIEFVQKMLIKDINIRPSAKEALEHSWFGHQSYKEVPKNGEEKEAVLNRITNFHFKNKLQAVVHTFIVSQLLTSEERMELLDVFREIDKNQNGIIDSDEIRVALLNKERFHQLDEKKINKIIEYIDTNCSGQIDYTEFLVAAIDFEKKINEKHFEQAFEYFDIDNSGGITFEEVAKFLEDEVESSADIKKMFLSVDQNGDGVISKSEFVNLLIEHKKKSYMS